MTKELAYGRPHSSLSILFVNWCRVWMVVMVLLLLEKFSCALWRFHSNNDICDLKSIKSCFSNFTGLL